MSPAPRNGRIFWTAAVFVVALDVITKALAVRHLIPHVPAEVFGSYGRLTLAYNPGAAFGMSLGDYSRYIFGGIKVVALVILWWLYHSWTPRFAGRSDNWMRLLALGLAWGGTAGNLIDRIRSARGVVDFIDIGVGDVRFWTFNVADSALTVGALMLAWVLWQDDREMAAAAASAASQSAASQASSDATHPLGPRDEHERTVR
jgi:signal peptidase II